MEVFTFVYMGGDVGRITVLPIHDRVAAVEPERPLSARRRAERACPSNFDDLSDPAISAILDQFAAFDANEAQCSVADDKQMILGVIETGIGSIQAFNELVRSTFANRDTGATTGGRGLSRRSSSGVVLGMENTVQFKAGDHQTPATSAVFNSRDTRSWF